jgi:hypothetical protein
MLTHIRSCFPAGSHQVPVGETMAEWASIGSMG